MINANDYKKNVYSLGGEDGIIEMLLNNHVTNPTGFVIEFGAADAYYGSNTAHLWMQGCDALLMECNTDHYALLEKNVAGRSNVEAHCAMVTDVEHFTNRIADVCSIDVDGDDYQIAERLVTPHQIVIVEYNPTVPPHVDMVNVEGSMYGSSAKSITALMVKKGYTLVACTKTNLFFLYGDHRDTFVTDLDVLFDRGSLNYVVTSYDGFYDTIGEFGYGYNRPAFMRLQGRPGEVSKTYDATIQEYMRQMVHISDAKGGA